jgi:HAD superfamily hydrolase (TIGR01509 family)
MIGNILFDIGVVLLHIDYDAALRQVTPLCDPAKRAALSRFLALDERDPIIAEYERGRVTTEAFFRHFADLTGYSGTFAQFLAGWHSTLSPNGPMIEFARELSAQRAVYLATNTGEVQIPRIYEFFPNLAFFRGLAASCYLGEVKPDRGFYEKALTQFGVAADSCLFVDDRPENVRGAEACGLRSVLYTTADDTIRAVRGILSG